MPAELADHDPADDVDADRASAQLLNELGRGDSDFVKRIVTTSPDVTVSTNLGPWVNRRNLFAREKMADTFKSERIASTFNWEFSPSGQHIELGIAENNLFIVLSALGLSHSINGERLFPIGTLYDPFIARGLDALNYACYQEARFILVATPSGITLAGEGGAHQSIGTPLIGMAQDGLAAFEPAYVDELAAIMAWSFDYIQKGGEGGAAPSATGCATRPAARSICGSRRARSSRSSARSTPTCARRSSTAPTGCANPGPNCQVVVAYTGAVAPEAIEAVGLMAEDRRDVGLLAVTSADRLNAGWTAAQRARERGLVHARSHIERLMADVPPHCGIVTVCDAHPATLGWLGAIHGHRTRALGVEHFGQTGSIAGPLSPLRHRRERDRRGRRGDRAGPADPLSQGACRRADARIPERSSIAEQHRARGRTRSDRPHDRSAPDERRASDR